MLTKVSTFANILRNTRRFMSKAAKSEEKLQAMREADYAAKRKETIDRFNQQLKEEKQLHNK